MPLGEPIFNPGVDPIRRRRNRLPRLMAGGAIGQTTFSQDADTGEISSEFQLDPRTGRPGDLLNMLRMSLLGGPAVPYGAGPFVTTINRPSFQMSGRNVARGFGPAAGGPAEVVDERTPGTFGQGQQLTQGPVQPILGTGISTIASLARLGASPEPITDPNREIRGA